MIEKKNAGFVKILWLVVAVVMYSLFGLSFVVGKETLLVVGPFFLTAVRMIFSGLVILLIQWLVDKSQCKWPKGAFLDLIFLSIFNIFLTNVLEFWGLQFLSCYKTCYLYSLSPFLAALFSYIFLRETLSRMKLFGLIIAFVGFFPLLVYKEASSGHKFYISAPEWALLGAAIATVIGWISMRKITYVKKYPLLMANSLSMLIGGVLSMIPSLIFEEWSPLPVSNMNLFLKGMVVIALINNIVAYNLYAFLVKKFTVTLMTFIGFITPLITALFGWIFLKETVTILFFISYAVVLVGFFLFSKEELSASK